MATRYLAEVLTPQALAAQERAYGRAHSPPPAAGRDALGPAEAEFIAGRDGFYMATVTSSGWPYLQHRGGPPGFLKALDPHTLGFADLRGNRQLVSTGNVAENDRTALFLMDYPGRRRLKIMGHARVLDANGHAELADALAEPRLRRLVERLFVLDVVGFDWNCPAYITPRYTEAEVEERMASARIRSRAVPSPGPPKARETVASGPRGDRRSGR